MVQKPDRVIARARGALHYPSDWARWTDCARRGTQPEAIGLNCDHGTLNRFAARYRAARAFGGLVLDDYTPAVADGYSASIKLFMSYAAFDGLCAAKGTEVYSAAAWLDVHITRDVAGEVRALDAGDKIMRKSLTRLNRKLQPKVAEYLEGKQVSFLIPVMALRHLFVHGFLTPSVNGADPVHYTRICSLLSEALLFSLDREFSLIASTLLRNEA